MPRRYRLTWQAGANRAGRWKKIYRGRVFYFDGGSGKTDASAHSAAMLAFEREKLLIDSELEELKPHRADYENAIAEWEIVLKAARSAEDETAVVAAAAKIAELRRRLSARNPGPVSKRFDWPFRRLGMSRGQVQPVLAKSDIAQAASAASDNLIEWLPVEESDETFAADIVRAHVATAIWQDRLAQTRAQTSSIESTRTLKSYIQAYLTRSESRGIKVGTTENVRRRLKYMRDFLGPDMDAALLTGKHVDDLHQRIMKDCECGVFSRTYGFDILSSVKSFLRWLHETDVLPQLPKNISGNTLRISREQPKIEILTIGIIRKLFKSASDALRLYMLLALNCGMTQIDISDLQPSAVNWKTATLTRRRGKTAQFEQVPTVQYALWPETIDLMRRLRTQVGDRLLTAPMGGPLKFEQRRNGKIARNDYVGSLFRRHRKAVGVEGDFKSLKKTSASLLRDHAEFNGLESVFLDHAPRSMSDRHYARVPEKLLGNGLTWLRKQYALVDLMEAE